jgi:hypothetical protein
MIQAMSQPKQAVPVQAQYAANGGHLFNRGGAPFVYTSSDGTTYGPREEYTFMPYMNNVVDLGDLPQNKYDPYQQMVIKRIQENHAVPNSFLPTMRSMEGQGFIGNKGASPLYYGYKFLDPNYRSPVLDLKVERPAFSDIAKDVTLETTTTNTTNNNTNNSLAQALRAVPAIGSGIGALVSMFDKPDYSNIERAERAINSVPKVAAGTIGQKLTYNPIDINYIATAANNQSIGARRAAIENSLGNSATALGQLPALNYTSQTALGNMFIQAAKENRALKESVNRFNRETDSFNIENALKADIQNQGMDYNKANFLLKTGMLRDEELAKVQANKSASISNFLNNMGNLGTDMQNRDMVQALIDSGAYYSISDAMGKTGFKVANGGKLRKKGGKDA